MTSRVEEIKFLRRYCGGQLDVARDLGKGEKMVAPCSCEQDGCTGWAMLPYWSDHAERGIAVTDLMADSDFDKVWNS